MSVGCHITELPELIILQFVVGMGVTGGLEERGITKNQLMVSTMIDLTHVPFIYITKAHFLVV